MILKEIADIQDPAEKLDFIKSNKAAILKEKKRQFKKADAIRFKTVPVKGETATKMDGTGESGVFEIVANSVGFFDSHEDVSMKGSWTKTVNEGGNMVPIIDNHQHGPSHVFAQNKGVSVKEVPIRDLGYDKDGSTEVVAAKIAPVYDAKMKQLYENGEIKQHSAGLQYVKLVLAINDPSDNEGYANWQKYIDQVINREEAEANKYFFAVLEQKLIEISAVLFGSNAYTPTLQESLKDEPPTSTQEPLEPTIELNGSSFTECFKNLT